MKDWVLVSQCSKFQTSVCVKNVDMILQRLTLVARAKTQNKKESLKGFISKNIRSCNLEFGMPSNQSNFRNFLGNIGDGHLGTFAKIG